jgi:hypothetical protein
LAVLIAQNLVDEAHFSTLLFLMTEADVRGQRTDWVCWDS